MPQRGRSRFEGTNALSVDRPPAGLVPKVVRPVVRKVFRAYDFANAVATLDHYYDAANAIWKPLTGEELAVSAVKAVAHTPVEAVDFLFMPERSLPGIVRFLAGLNRALRPQLHARQPEYSKLFTPYYHEFSITYNVVTKGGK